ncbi:MAG: hypothetical protein DWI29_02335 [Planctomycetota bacterium]|nr:MAG: hypothetical protein DWI29_02335 [Planctomycetota bacterium]
MVCLWRVNDKLLKRYVLRDNGFVLKSLPRDGPHRNERFSGSTRDVVWANKAHSNDFVDPFPASRPWFGDVAFEELIMTIRIVYLLLIALALLPPAIGTQLESVSSENRSLVPRQLMALLHAPEIHQELKLSSKQVTELESLFAQIDGPWFQLRNQSPQQQLPILDSLDLRVHSWLAEHTTTEQRQRLRQIELQAQSVRMLLGNDLAVELKLDSMQQERFAKLARSTEAAQSALQKAVMSGEPSDELQSKAKAAAKAEHDAVGKVLKPEQARRLQEMLGESFEIAKLKRIYPMAPEFVAVEDWLNSKPLTLKGLRGKVVLVHFYAFQCHNCHANFEIYRRWHEQWREKGVVVVGIQTPETTQERDPVAVKSAAAERKLEFPIMVDVASKNWEAWGNTMWPTVYVVDKNGYLRQWWQGELNWKGATGDKTIEQAVQQLLVEP